MTDKFKKEIKNFKYDLFYNIQGSPEAYKLCIRHISYAPTMGLGIIIGKEFIPTNDVYLVDLKKEKIINLDKKIKIIPIQELR